MKALLVSLYATVLRYLELAKRRCGRSIPEPCVAREFPQVEPEQKSVRTPRCQHTLTRNLRRRMGGWSGAIACRSQVSH